MKRNLVRFISLIIVTILIFQIPVYANQYREKTNLDNIDSNRYPGYKEKLKQLQSEHPNWNFTIFYTGLDWSSVVNNETVNYHGRSLVQGKTGEWLCPVCGDKVYDGSNWYCASGKATSYYLDPRNFLDTEHIFQFETLSFVEGVHTEARCRSNFKWNFHGKYFAKNIL